MPLTPIPPIASSCRAFIIHRVLVTTTSRPGFAARRFTPSDRWISSPARPLINRAFWRCRHTWRRAAVNTFRCLVGCSLGDLSVMWYLMSYHPTMDAAASMGLSMTAGITTSIMLETSLLHFGKDRLAWDIAARTASGMSLLSMLGMELTENMVTLGLAGGAMSLADGRFWLITALSMTAGFLAPLPYNYFRLKYFGRACH